MLKRGGNNATSSQPKPSMKLNKPPSATGISTDALYERSDQESSPAAASATKAEELLGALPTSGVVRKIPLSLIDDSPFQPRLRYDPITIDALGESLKAGGQAEPISVRVIGNRFQLLGGHRRTRAARNIGWSDIEAHVKECDDHQAEQIALLQNEAREDLSEYERAKMYSRALERGFAKTQTELANLFGCSQGTISNCLKMLKLPEPVKALLEEKPEIVGVTLAKVIFELNDQYPNELPLLVEGVQRVAEGAESTSLKNWFMLKMANRGRQKKRKSDVFVTGKSGRTLFSARAANGKIQVTLAEDLAVDEDTVLKWVLAALRDRAQQADSTDADLPPK